MHVTGTEKLKMIRATTVAALYSIDLELVQQIRGGDVVDIPGDQAELLIEDGFAVRREDDE